MGRCWRWRVMRNMRRAHVFADYRQRAGDLRQSSRLYPTADQKRRGVLRGRRYGPARLIHRHGRHPRHHHRDRIVVDPRARRRCWALPAFLPSEAAALRYVRTLRGDGDAGSPIHSARAMAIEYFDHADALELLRRMKGGECGLRENSRPARRMSTPRSTPSFTRKTMRCWKR